MGLDADAVAVARGELAVLTSADALAIVEAAARRPVPVAVHRTPDDDVVLFFIKQSDGNWRTEVVAVRGGEIASSGGGTGGGIVRRSDVQPGEPSVAGEGRHFLDHEKALVQIDGVSADEAVAMVCEDRVVAEAFVAAHGYFVLAAVIDADAEVKVTAAPRGRSSA